MSELEKVKKLRKLCGAGFKDCLLALKESNGDIDKALEILRIKGISKASKKMSRNANEGVIAVSGDENKNSLIEVNCETDFVAKNDDFINFVKELSDINNQNDSNLDDLKKSKNLKCVIDVRSGLLNKRDVNHSFRKKIKLIALDCESAVISEVLSNISIDNIINSEKGSRSISGVRIVAKGEWGREGDIVVDKINKPGFIIGASDGQGTLKSDPSSEDKKKLKKILNHLYNNKLN